MSSASSSDLLKIECEMYQDLCLCFLCYCYCVILLLLFICHCVSTRTDAEDHNYLVTTTRSSRATTTKDQYTLIVQSFCSDDWSFYSFCYCVILLLLLFICSCGFTMTDAEQPQNGTVTTRTTQSNLHKLLSVQYVISPIPMHDLPLQ